MDPPAASPADAPAPTGAADVPMSRAPGCGILAERMHHDATAWLVLAISLCITAFSWWLADRYVAERAQDRFTFEVQKARQAIVKRMQEYEQVLRGGVGLFLASDRVTRDDWHQYVDNLNIDTYWPGIQGVGHAVMLSPGELAGHVAAMRDEGFKDYAVHPAGQRPQYSAILYLEPFAGRNLRAFGYDMYAEPTRRAAMDQACDTGMPAVSGRVILVQETGRDTQAGFLMYLPLYRRGMPLDSATQRRAAHYGFVYSAFRIKDLMHGILGPGSPYLDFEIFDGRSVDAAARLYATHDSHAYPADAQAPRFSDTSVIELPGHTWTVHFHSSAALERDMANAQPLIIGIGGLAVDILLFAIIWSLSRSRRLAAHTAQSMARLLEEARLSASVFEHAREGILITDAQGRIVNVNRMFTELTGYRRDEAIGRNPSMLNSGLHDPAFFQQMWRILDNSGSWSGEIWNRHKDGEVHAEIANISAVHDCNGRTTHYVALYTDITAQKTYQKQLEHMAQHDALTQLPNRGLLFDRMTVALSQARRSGRELAVAYLDLDGFKPINDELGHEAGDEALVEVAHRLKACIRAGDSVARLGGDEFALVLCELVPGEHQSAMERVRQALHAPYLIKGREVRMSASIGYTLFPADDAQPETLLQHADKAMYLAKQRGRDNYCQYPAAPAS